MPLNIATAIDSLVELVKYKKKISLESAAKELGLPENIINEWAHFLEEERIIQITYKFTTPYLEFKEEQRTKDNDEELKRRLDLATRKLEFLLSSLKKTKIQHKYEIKDINDVRVLLKKYPDEKSADYVYAEKFTLEYKINNLLETIERIKLLTPDLLKYIEKKVNDIEEKKKLFDKNLANLK